LGCVAKNGYGYLSLKAAHRVSYELFKGPIPKGLHIDHLCRVRCCINPDHLEAVTLVENVMREVSFSPKNAAKTHCNHEHEFSVENTFVKPTTGERVCRACMRRNGLASYYRKKKMKLPVASHTLLKTFESCAYKGYRIYITKDLPKTEQTPEMKLGSAVHKALAAFISRGRPLPEEFRKYETLASPLSREQPFTELPLAVDRDGRACGFFDDHVFCRGYGDVVVIHDRRAALFDWKTGKKREDPGELELHGLMLKASHPELESINAHYVWLKNVDIGLPVVGERHDVSDTVATWQSLEQQMDEIEHMLTVNNFPKQPNPLCAYCQVLDCEHNKVVK
jgi:hypothetical protein